MVDQRVIAEMKHDLDTFEMWSRGEYYRLFIEEPPGCVAVAYGQLADRTANIRRGIEELESALEEKQSDFSVDELMEAVEVLEDKIQQSVKEGFRLGSGWSDDPLYRGYVESAIALRVAAGKLCRAIKTQATKSQVAEEKSPEDELRGWLFANCDSWNIGYDTERLARGAYVGRAWLTGSNGSVSRIRVHGDTWLEAAQNLREEVADVRQEVC